MRKYHLQDHNTNKLIIEESSLSDREIAAYLEYKNKVVEECRKIN